MAIALSCTFFLQVLLTFLVLSILFLSSPSASAAAAEPRTKTLPKCEFVPGAIGVLFRQRGAALHQPRKSGSVVQKDGKSSRLVTRLFIKSWPNPKMVKDVKGSNDSTIA